MNRVILSLVVFSSSISTLVNAQTIERSQVLVANFNAPLPLSPLGTSYVPLRVPPFGYTKNAVSKPWGFDTFLGTVAPSIPFGADDNKGAPKNCKNNTFNKHLGSDYAAPAGTTVYAIADGVIKRVGGFTGIGDYYVVVESGSTDKWTTLYGHLNRPAFPNTTKGHQCYQAGRCHWNTVWLSGGWRYTSSASWYSFESIRRCNCW